MTQLRHIVRQTVLEPNVAACASTRLATRAKNSDSSIVLVHWSNQPLEVSERCSNLALELFRELFEVFNSVFWLLYWVTPSFFVGGMFISRNSLFY